MEDTGAERIEDLPVFTLNRTAAPEPRFDFEPIRQSVVPDTHGALPLPVSKRRKA